MFSNYYFTAKLNFITAEYKTIKKKNFSFYYYFPERRFINEYCLVRKKLFFEILFD